MLGLALKEEFRGKRITETAIEFFNDSNQKVFGKIRLIQNITDYGLSIRKLCMV